MKYIPYIFIVCLILLGAPTVARMQLTGGSYEIYDDTFSFIGGRSPGKSEGGVYTLYQTGGDFFAGSSSGGDYELRGGFRAVEKGILSVSFSTTSFDLGLLSTSTVASSSVELTVTTDNFNGYILYLTEDENPETVFGDTIADVFGGTVTAGTEGYGVALFGTDAYAPGLDNAVPTSTNLAVAGSDGEVRLRTTTIRYSVAISPTTTDGIYTHTLAPLILVNP